MSAISGDLPVDGALVEWKAGELERAARGLECSAERKTPLIAFHLEEINRKLELIAGRLVNLSPMNSQIISQDIHKPL